MSKFSRFGLLILLLISSGAIYANDYSRFQSSCDKRVPDQNSSVIPGGTEYQIDKSKDIADITQISKDSNFESVSFGLTVATSFIKINSKVLFFNPHPDVSCGKVGFAGDFSLSKHVVYVAKEYPPDSCEYKKILEHELLHANLNVRNIKKIVDELNFYLNSKYKRKVLFGKSGNFETQSILQDAKDYAKDRWEFHSLAQKEIDQITTWDMVIKECKEK